MTEKTVYGIGDSTFQAAGGEAGIQALVEEFYLQMSTLESAKTIKAMHKEDLTLTKDKLFRFLCGWMGGPKLFQEKYGSIVIPMAHNHLDIGTTEIDAWLECMQKALQKQPYSEELQVYLLNRLSIPAGLCQTRAS
jgi:hemoglobin